MKKTKKPITTKFLRYLEGKVCILQLLEKKQLEIVPTGHRKNMSVPVKSSLDINLNPEPFSAEVRNGVMVAFGTLIGSSLESRGFHGDFLFRG